MQAGYDAATGRLASLAHVAGASDLSRFAYSYNGVGNIAGIAESGDIGVQTKSFTYDELQRLTAGGTAAAPETYSYDAVGNRDVTHLSALHVVNDADRLLEDEQFTYAYDANGNLTTKTAKVGGAVTGYTWDAQDQLIQITRPDAAIVAYAYDALGRRIEKNVAGVVTRYVYDGEDIYIETDGTSTLQARYAHGDRTDQPLSFERGGADFFYHADHQGSVRQVTDTAGLVVNSYEYDSYGRFLTRVETVAQLYGYTAREQDEESDLYYYRARYYDPNAGRFISQDPLGFGSLDLNMYRYALNNPIGLNDADGEI
jgi:RHS repeat-associated protein